MTEDGELLRRYVEEGSEEAFTELVQRHIHVIHAIAMRRSNGDSHLGSDVTQKVFISLARHARELVRHPAITGWLYTSTRNAVLDVLRSERRRQRREKEAMVMYENENEPDPGELNDKLLLDALDQLNTRDREAVVMRFFHGFQFRQIGTLLRLSEDAARMRVDRALAKLRSQLERRGLTSSAAALAATLANNTGLGAPAGLTLQVTQAALAVGPAGVLTVGGILSLLSSAKLPLALTAAALLVLGGWGFNQDRQIGRLETSLAAILVERTQLVARLEAGRQAAARAPAPPRAVTVAKPDPAAELRAKLDAMPEKKIPELELLADGAWQSTVRVYPSIADEKQLMTAFQSVRDSARARFALLAIDALQRYAVTNAGLLPKQVSDLAPYFEEPISPAIFTRYAMLRAGNYDELPPTTALIGEISGVVDEFGDSSLRFGRTPQSVILSSGSSVVVRVQRAANSFAAEHQGVFPTKADELGSYFSTDELKAVQTELDRMGVRASAGKAAPAGRRFQPASTP